MQCNTKVRWLFDLDDTLHHASQAIFPVIHANMHAFMAPYIGTDAGNNAAEVDAVREAYWRRYGATLLGMVKHHQVQPADFLRAAHRFDDLQSLVQAERRLRHVLKRLPGPKILLTNAPLLYTKEILRHLRLQRYFIKLISIESMYVHRQLRPKPARILLQRVLARERMSARHSVLVEDSIATLKAAKAVGMQTVWVTQYLHSKQRKRPHYVDVKVKSVRQLPKRLAHLR